MFGWFKKKNIEPISNPDPPKEDPPPPRFKRGEKVRDIYGGPEMFIDSPRCVLTKEFRTFITRDIRVKCCWWRGDKIKHMYYEEDELNIVN